MRSLRELWRISKPLYHDLILGELIARRSGRNLEKVVKSVRINALINKLLLAAFLTIVCVNSAMGGITDILIFYLLAMFIVTFFFLHTMTTFVSKGFDILYTLPLSYDEIAKVRLFVFLRVFDIPLLLMTIAFPVAMLYFRGTFFTPLLCVLSIDVISIYLSVKFAKFFYERITYSTSSLFSSILRTVTYLAWGVAVVGIYSISTILNVLSKFKDLDQIMLKYDFVFPINYAVISCGHLDPKALITSVPFFVLSVYLLKSTLKEILRSASLRFEATSYDIKPSGRIMAFIKKDLRIVTRNPGFTLILMIPLVQGLIFGLTFDAKRFLDQIVLATVVAGFLPMVAIVLLGIENFELLSTLPVRGRDITIAKSILIFMVYLVSSAILIFKTDILLPISPAVFAMSVVSCKIAESLDVTKNIYVGLWKTLTVIIVSYVLIFVPIMFGFVAFLIGQNPIIWIAIPSAIEFLISILILAR